MQFMFRLPVNNLQSVQLTVRVDCAAQCAFAPTKIRVFFSFSGFGVQREENTVRARRRAQILGSVVRA